MYTEEDIAEAKEILRASGYYVDCLWHTDDVYRNAEFNDIDPDEIDDYEAQDILSDALSSDWLMEKINDEIGKYLDIYDRN